MPTSPASVVIQATPEIRVQAEAPQIVVVGEANPAEIVVLAASNIAGPQGPPGVDGTEAVLEHIDSELPHPVYDDGPSLLLIYENAKV